MKEIQTKIQDLIESNQIKWSIDQFGECTVCGWEQKSSAPHMCKIVNATLEHLDAEINKLYETASD